MFGNYRRFRERAARLPSEQVSREEFVRRFIAAGLKPADAEAQAKVAEGLGSEVECGGAMLSIAPEPPGEMEAGGIDSSNVENLTGLDEAGGVS